MEVGKIVSLPSLPAGKVSQCLTNSLFLNVYTLYSQPTLARRHQKEGKHTKMVSTLSFRLSTVCV